MAIKSLNSAGGFGLDNGNVIIDENGNVAATNLVVSGTSNLGPISNVTITGGSNGQVLTTDGNGILSFSDASTGIGNIAAVMPTYIPVACSYTVQSNFQGLFGAPITIDGDFEIDGTLVDVGGNIIIGNGTLSVANISASGNVSGDYILGNGYYLTGISGGGTATALNANIANVSISGGTSGYYLQTDGAGNLSWAAGGGGGGGSPGGANTQIQFNDAGTFAGNSTFTFNKSTGFVAAPNIVVTGNITPSANVTYSLGNNTNRFNNLYLAGNTIVLGGATISANATSLTFSNPSGGNFVVAGAGNSSSNTLLNGNSNIAISSNSNIAMTVAGNANVFVVTGTGANITGTFNASGNISGANITGTHYGAATGLTSIPGANVSGAVPYATTANSVAGANVSGTVSSATTAGTVTTAAQPNITSVGTLTSLTVSGNATAGNLDTDGVLVANGNITTNNYVIANNMSLGSNATVAGQLTVTTIVTTGSGGNISGANVISANLFIGSLSGSLSNGNSNVNIPSSNGNVTISASGNANIIVITGTGANVNGTLDVSGNATVGNIIATNIGNIASIDIDGSSSNVLYGNGVFAPAAATYDNSNVAIFLASFGSNTITTTGNITAGNVIGNGASLSSLTGANVTGAVSYATTANSVAAANVSGLGNVALINKDGNASNVLYGNGVFAPVSGGGSYGNSNVATFLASFGSNTITTTGNVTVGNIIATNIGNIASIDIDGSSSNVLYGNGVFAPAAAGGYGNSNVATFLASFGSNSITTTGNISVGNLVANTGNVVFGSPSNITITGGTSGYVLQTDGAGNLSWVAQSGGGGTATALNATVANTHITGGTSGYVLQTDGTGNLSWAAQTGGASAGVFYENDQVVSANYTITSGKSAMSTGPINIASGVSVTVPAGSKWVVL